MNFKRHEITLMQYIFIIHGSQVGIGILQMPRMLAEKAGTDGWIAIGVSWLLSMAVSLLIVQIMAMYPQGTIIDLLDRVFGKWAAKTGALVIAAAFAFATMTVMFRAILFIKAFILPRTADYMLFLLFAIPTYLILSKGVRVLGRYSELVFLILIWMPFFYLFAFPDFHWLYLLPVLKEGWMPVLKAVPDTVTSFDGFEIAFFLYPFLRKKESASAGIVIANTLTMLVYMGITVICFVFFSPEGILDTNEPTLTILKVIEFHFLERLELIFLAFYLFVVSTTWMPFLFWSATAANRLFGITHSNRTLIVLLLAMFVILLFHRPYFNENDRWQELYSRFIIGFAYVFPVCLWGYLRIRQMILGRRPS
ncbi:endospore germination permease [Paenibacillus sp. MBLB4367]|uniref:GerAB/ArcD/ProY family transporter n=1 Tax=Paenibacillus sp. MBLB4367 TaxID=3384767 RepID=UPI003908280F